MVRRAFLYLAIFYLARSQQHLPVRRQLNIVRCVQVLQHLLCNPLEHRRGDLAALVQPAAESRITATVITGLLMGAKPAKDATYFECEYAWVAGSTFCAVPVLPADV